jgi:hypothetical protein
MAFVVLSVPAWVWATLLMTAFVVVSLLTMWLARYALQEPNSPHKRRGTTPSADQDRSPDG